MTDPSRPAAQPAPPVSSVAGVPGELLQHSLIAGPARPGDLGTLGRYQLLSVLGEGGMGVVFRALDSQSGMEVALKVLRPPLAAQPQQVHRFLKEARHAQRLKHPNILPVLHVSEDPNTPYFVMPLMTEGSLLRRISDEQLLPEADCVAIARQVAAGLACAHGKGIIHHDLKPGNVLLDGSGKAVLADFGLARTVFNDSLVDAAKGETGEGTAHYMSPQLARGEAEDTRCDIYAFGALLYEMLTGRPPYEGPSTAQILQQIRNGPPAPVGRRRPDLSPDLVKVVEGAMAREHRDRYANMTDVLTDLERIQQGQPSSGPRSSFSLRRLIASRARSLALIGLVFLGAFAAVAAYDWFEWDQILVVEHEMTQAEVPSWRGAITGDWDGDGSSELVLLQKDQIYPVSIHGQPYQACLLDVPPVLAGLTPSGDDPRKPFRLGQVSDVRAGFYLLADANHDGLDEAFVSWTRGSNAHLTAFNQLGFALRDFAFTGSVKDHPEWNRQVTALLPLRVADLDGDGRKEVLAAPISTWALEPRGVACFDLETTKMKWFYPTANFIHGVELIDLDADGKAELFLQSNSPGNFKDGETLVDGTDDRHVYAYVLSAEGRLLWRTEMSGIFAEVVPLRLQRGNRAVAWAYSGHEHSVRRNEGDVGKVVEFDAAGRVDKEWDLGVTLTDAMVTDLDGDGHEEIFAADRHGMIHVLNDALQERQPPTVVEKSASGSVLLKFIGRLPSVAAGRSFIALTSSRLELIGEPGVGNTRTVPDTSFMIDSKILVLDHRLKVVATHPIAERSAAIGRQIPEVRLLQAKSNGLTRLAVLTSKIQILSLRESRMDLLSFSSR